MGDLKDILLTWAVLFGISQLIAFLIDLIAWAAAVLICKPNNPRPELFGSSAIIFFLFLHWHLTGLNTIARIELNKYLKAQSK